MVTKHTSAKDNRSVADRVQSLIDAFREIPGDSLSLIVKNQVDVVELAKVELASRGLNENAKWQGFQSFKETP